MQTTTATNQRGYAFQAPRARSLQPMEHRLGMPKFVRWLYQTRPALMPTVYVPGPVVAARKV